MFQHFARLDSSNKVNVVLSYVHYLLQKFVIITNTFNSFINANDFNYIIQKRIVLMSKRKCNILRTFVCGINLTIGLSDNFDRFDVLRSS